MCVCEVSPVCRISYYQPEGPGFNPQHGRVFNFGQPSFATPSLDRNVLSEDLKEPNHTLVDKSRLMSVLWTM